MVSDGGVVKIYDFWMTEKGEAYQIQDKIGRQIPIKWTAPEALLSGKREREIEIEIERERELL